MNLDSETLRGIDGVRYSAVELAAKYGKWVGFRSNHVIDEFGNFFDENHSSRGISNETDRQLLVALRDQSDRVIVDAATARAEKYRGLKSGKLAIVSKTATFSGIPAVEDSTSKVLLLVPRGLVGVATSNYPQSNLYVAGFDDANSFQSIREELSLRGNEALLLETGPTLTQIALVEGELSQACTTQTFKRPVDSNEETRFPFAQVASNGIFQPKFSAWGESSIFHFWEPIPRRG